MASVANQRLHVNYGDDGFRLFVVAAVGAFGAGLVGVSGLCLLLLSPVLGDVFRTYGYALMLAGALAEVLPIVRARQAALAGRSHRAGRPFER